MFHRTRLKRGQKRHHLQDGTVLVTLDNSRAPCLRYVPISFHPSRYLKGTDLFNFAMQFVFRFSTWDRFFNLVYLVIGSFSAA